MKKIVLLFAAVFVMVTVFFTTNVKADQQIDFDAVTLNIENVRGNVFVIYGPGGNIGVSAGDDGVFLIDDQFGPLTSKLIETVKTVSDQPIRFIVNTHWHPDHTGGNENLGEMGVLILAHDNVYEFLSTERASEQFAQTFPAQPDAALPVVTFSDSSTLHFNGDEARMFHIPRSHTNGDVAVYFKGANVLHMGDAFIQEGYPLIDWSSGGSIEGMLAGFQTALDLADDDTLIIPGHGKISHKTDLESYMKIVQTIRDRIYNAIVAGKSVDEVIAMHPTAEWDETHTNPYVTGESLTIAIYKTLMLDMSH